jgi:hypothetical protein
MLTFDPSKASSDIKPWEIDNANSGIAVLHSRKVDSVALDSPSQLERVGHWIDTYVQAHIRRAISLIEGGISEINAGRPLTAAFSARALMEDAAVFWIFLEEVRKLLDQPNNVELQQFVFSKAFASRLPKFIDRIGKDFVAQNVLTAIDKMTKLNKGYRAMYDELSDVCHPNVHGVLLHFANIQTPGVATFDDGARMTDNAFGALVSATNMLIAALPALDIVEFKLDVLSGKVPQEIMDEYVERMSRLKSFGDDP